MKKVKAILLSVGIMTATSALLLSFLAFIVSKTGSLPRGIEPVISTVAGSAAVFLGGFAASLYAREKGVLLGMFSGLLFAICLAVVTLLLFERELTLSSFGKLAAILLSGSIGGILGVNRKEKVKF